MHRATFWSHGCLLDHVSARWKFSNGDLEIVTHLRWMLEHSLGINRALGAAPDFLTFLAYVRVTL
jgi:hypothetical protein